MPEPSSSSATDSCSLHGFDELLSLDDIFVEYFNEFLRLGLFVPKVEYNRQLNTFIEKKIDPHLNNDDQFLPIDDDRRESQTETDSIYSGFSDFIELDQVPQPTEKHLARLQKFRQVQMMDWAKTERLALFWRTELYRQYKLCKLLLRPIAIERDQSEYSSQGIGGYSRQSVYTAARTLSTENSSGNLFGPTGTVDEDDDQTQQGDTDPSKPWLNINSLFENNLVTTEFLRMPRAFLRPGSRAYSVPATMVSSLSMFLPSAQGVKPKKYSKRSTSSKTSQPQSTVKDDDPQSASERNDPMSGSLMSAVKMQYFDENELNEDFDDFQNIRFQMQGSNNQLRYKFLGSFKGMQSFIRFLKTTNGGYELYRFWMDCEFFKDTMAGLDQVENVVARTRLFRDLNDDKYHLPFMRHLQNKIRRAYLEASGTLSHDIFLQVQYDVLRRLRMYWSARFIVHQLFQKQHPTIDMNDFGSRPSTVCLYPIDKRAKANLIEMNRIFVSNDFATDTGIFEGKQTVSFYDEIEKSFQTAIMKKYLTVIRQDKQGGGLFLRYITFKERRLLALMLFCYDIDDFRYSNIDDKVLEAQHGLAILNTYFGNSAKLSLDNFMPDIQIDRWIKSFELYQFDKLTFQPLFKRALLILQDSWLRCLKDDIDHFTKAYYLALSSSGVEKDLSADDDEQDDEVNESSDEVHEDAEKPKSSVSVGRVPTRVHSPDTQLSVANNMIYVKRPWLIRFISSATSDRKQRFLEALENAMTDEERQRLRLERRERLRRIQENRKKAAKAAKERRKRLAKEKEKQLSSPDKTSQQSRNEIPLYIDRILPYKIGLMQSKDFLRLISGDLQRFAKTQKTAIQSFDQKLNLLIEVAKWFEAHNNYEKQQQYDKIKKMFFDPQSKRGMIPLNEEQTEILDANAGRPDIILFQTLYRDFRMELEDEFLRYCEDRIRRFGLDTIEEFLSKTADELSLLLNDLDQENRTSRDDEEDYGGLFDPEMGAVATNGDGTAKVTRKHTADLLQVINDASVGRFNEHFYHFYAYLTHWVGEKDTSYLDQDFLFCIDVGRLKEIANENLVQSKIRYILETYLEAGVTSTNFACRLDISSSELQMKILRALQKSLGSNTNDFGILEEARTYLVKERLVKYFAGYKAYRYRMELSKSHPSQLARLQEQWNTYQQQLRAQKSAKSQTRSSASTNKNQNRKVQTPTSKHSQSGTITPIDLTMITKTQRLLNERMKLFDKLPENQIIEVPFPAVQKLNRGKSANPIKGRNLNQVVATPPTYNERLNSAKDKNRGPLVVQYSLTTGLKLKCSDGKTSFDPVPIYSQNGTVPLTRGNTVYSINAVAD